mmetsp:Transcript_18304/g.19888  ORF Transcript_18304/g.19888 Transcript_18304/m.19888 type:complete len:149 (+) Transcript_18304:197-643(+)
MMKSFFQPKFHKAEPTNPPSKVMMELHNVEKYAILSSPVPHMRSTSTDSTSSCSSSILSSSPSFSSPASLYGSPSKPKDRRKVRFDPTARVVLIPSLEEYKEANLHQQLWYGEKELKLIERRAIVNISTGKLFDDSDDFWSFIPHIDD